MFDFLANVVINDQEEVVAKVRKGGPRKERNPEGLAIRLFRDGSVFPSQELVDKFNLEYVPAILKERKPVGEPKEGEEQKYQNVFEIEGEPGFGFDVIDTKLFSVFQIPGKRLLLISAVDRSQPKIDLFGSTTYNDNGTPKTSVLGQGAKTFGAESLIPMVEEVYGVKFNRNAVEAKEATDTTPAVEAQPAVEDGLDFVDLQLIANPATGEPWALPPVVFVPKTITRGERKGELTVTRREKASVYVFMPVTEETKTAQGTEAQGVAAQ
jgi:hypothetical protein